MLYSRYPAGNRQRKRGLILMDDIAISRAFRADDAIAQSALVPVAATGTSDPAKTIGIITVELGRGSLQKRYQWTVMDASGHLRHHSFSEPGTFLSQEELASGVGEWRTVGVPGKVTEHYYREIAPASLQELAATLQALPSCSCVVQGALRPGKHSGAHVDYGLWVTRRDGSHYQDRPSVWLFLDIDGMPVNYDLRTAAREDVEKSIDELLASALPALADCSYVWAFTSSAGLKPGLRARVVLQLAKPLTLTQQKRLVSKSPPQAKFDCNLYKAAGLVFTAPPFLYAQSQHGQGAWPINMPRPVTDAWHYVERDSATVVLDAGHQLAVQTPHERLVTAASGDGIARSASGCEAILNEIGTDAGVEYPLKRLIGSLAWTTPESERAAMETRWRSRVWHRIAENSPASEVQRRLEP